MILEPIGIFHADSKHPYEAPRQAVESDALGEIVLRAGLEQALEDLEGFERIWILFHFDRNRDWKPKVMPARGPRVKRGVFATRAPYRPNAIGMSCVRLVRIEGLRVIIEGHDLLDQTPVLDIKPYIPYADAFPEARMGWLENVEEERFEVKLGTIAREHLNWLEGEGVSQLRGFIQSQLAFDPTDSKRKRVTTEGDGFVLAYRTWRARFSVSAKAVVVHSIHSGYSAAELSSADDPYGDKDIHRRFIGEEE